MGSRRVAHGLFLGSLAVVAACADVARAQQLYLSSGHAWPGLIWLSEGHRTERQIHRRGDQPLVSAPGMVQRLARVAADRDGKVYLCSGLDGYIFHKIDGHEVVSLQFDGQIRDISCTDEDHVIYFSAVPTPQGREPLADGSIYRFDLYEAKPVEIARVRQADVGGDWWGSFAIRDGVIYVATLTKPAHVYKLPGGSPELVYKSLDYPITSFDFGRDGDIYFTNGTDKVYRTRDFHHVGQALWALRRITDVALPPSNN